MIRARIRPAGTLVAVPPVKVDSVRVRPRPGDVVLALVIAAIAVAGTVLGHGTALNDPVPGLTMAGFAGAMLVLRRIAPLVTLAVVAASVTSYLIMGYPYGPILFAIFIAVYTVARHLRPARSVPASLAAMAVLMSHAFINDYALPVPLSMIAASAWAVVPFAIGFTVRVQREAAARAKEEAERELVSGERLRVAQEVHDVVGHGLVAIKMQADVALHVLARKPEQAQAALTAISRTSTEALDELRATLATVHSGADLAPAPGLERLDELLRRMREAGVRVRVEVTGDRRSLPAAVNLAGYRVVQESLTNVLRHNKTKVATVRVGYGAGVLSIVVSNPMSQALVSGDGLGIPGMRERVTSLGGSFRAGPAADGRFEVRADLPVEEYP